MRFEDWDVLLFPRDSKVPMKEFKTNCHVVHDTEFAYTHGSFGLPTMTCFMPAMPPGTPFNISLHCWKTPDVSQFTRNYSKHPELVKFEARVLVDGRLVASSCFDRLESWPQLINHSFEFTKNGDLETLRFPPFRSEVLRQNYWSPGDEVGRIKIVISEGFPRDSLTVPIERVKNIVAFSFQHAPLDILESSGIAWPNPSMWRRSQNSTMPVPSQHHEDGPDAHLHSPRRRTSHVKRTSHLSGYGSGPPGLTHANPSNILGSMPNTQAMLQRSGTRSLSVWADPFNSQKSDTTACFDWASNFGPSGYTQAAESSKPNYNSVPNRRTTAASRLSRSDASMPDYGLSNLSNVQAVPDHHFLNDLSTSSFTDADTSAHDPKAPANTPTAIVGPNFVDDLDIDVSNIGTPGTMSMNDYINPHHTNFSSELATSLTHSLLNQPNPLPVKPGNIHPPATEVKSRKESRLNHDSPNEQTTSSDQVERRKISQTYSNLGKENQVNSAAHSPPSQSTFSGVFSNRSGSAGDFGNDLTNVSSMFTQPTMDSQIDSDASTDARGMGCPEKSVKRTRHFTPASSKMTGDDGKTLLRSPSVQDVLDEHFGAPI
ncbi:hypothetical protein GGR53DRAFT_66107 [Hypoxylon sp. FL1150]|nr:hypothetical protein GGR53DRAFT_66107 [Hypoxylon sp. FL1150]